MSCQEGQDCWWDDTLENLFEVIGFDCVVNQKGLEVTPDEKKKLSVRKAQCKQRAWLKQNASKVKKSLSLSSLPLVSSSQGYTWLYHGYTWGYTKKVLKLSKFIGKLDTIQKPLVQIRAVNFMVNKSLLKNQFSTLL